MDAKEREKLNQIISRTDKSGYEKVGLLIDFIESYHQAKSKEEGYAYFDGQLFPIGSRLTSKENGELIIAPPGTPDELIVGIVK